MIMSDSAAIVDDDNGPPPGPDGVPEPGPPNKRSERSNPIGLSSDEAVRAYDGLMKRSAQRGVFKDDGEVLMHLPADHDGDKNLEDNYAKPAGFCIVSRSIIPETMKMEQVRTAAVRELPGNATEQDIEDMIAFIIETRKAYSASIKSKLTVHIVAQIKKGQIVYNKTNKNVSTITEALTAYNSQEPTLERCGQYHKIFYTSFAVPGLKERMVHRTMMQMQLWHSNDQDKLNCTHKTGRLKTSCFRRICNDKAREYLNPYTKVKRQTHGVQFSVTVPGGRKAHGMSRRKPDEGFIPNEYIVGWNDDRHKSFCVANGFEAPKPLPGGLVPHTV
jgi:hypothetical protein